jgi:hypothetical protein
MFFEYRTTLASVPASGLEKATTIRDLSAERMASLTLPFLDIPSASLISIGRTSLDFESRTMNKIPADEVHHLAFLHLVSILPLSHYIMLCCGFPTI